MRDDLSCTTRLFNITQTLDQPLNEQSLIKFYLNLADVRIIDFSSTI